MSKYFLVSCSTVPIRLCTYLLLLNSSRDSTLLQILCLTIKFSSKPAPITTPDDFNIISETAVNTPPEELFSLTESFLCFTANAVGNLLSSIDFLLIGHTFLHLLQFMHIESSILGRKKPSSSACIVIQFFGQIEKQAAQPVHFLYSQIKLSIIYHHF